ncbi:MAG TPA: WD40 repeat domain-containing serine/threonine-protein kinase [Ktedonobacteraceae bacterium]|nr:WD40 repeat domain-containing serine/threonine-protein kinase [Ktedonobacteraceae bacterium]
MARSVNANVSSSLYCQACGAANPVLAMHCFACGERLSTATAGTRPTTNPLTGLLLPEVLMQQRYRILEVLSTAEVSTVYKAEDIQLGNRLVTLKELGKNNADTQEALALIEEGRREMLTLAGLIHPNLPRIYDYFVENQRWYFVMDFLEGETLAAYLSKRKYRPLAFEEVLDSGIQLATVLDYLHVHQPPLGFNDLTLDMIWRTPDGKLYLLEVGTPAPAIVRPQHSSVYSLGKLLRQLQAGKIAARIRSRIALPRRRKWSRHPQETLKVLIRQMVHRNVRKRPYTMRMVKQELQQLAAQLIPPQKRRISRRTLFKLGGLAALAAGSSFLTRQAALLTHRQVPQPGYSPNLGGTIYTYDATSSVFAVAWSPGGTRLVLGAWGPHNEGQVQALDAKTGQYVINYRDPSLQQRIEAVAWLPDGRSIVAGGDDNLVWVWDAATGEMQGIYRGHSDVVITVASSPDSKYIASAGQDRTVRVWEVATGNAIVTYSGHAGGIGSVAWSPGGNYIASASFDKTVQIWEAATGRTVFTYYGHTDRVYTVAWSPDGQRIASGGRDLTVQVWPAPFTSAGQRQNSIIYRGHTRAIQAVAWSPDSRTIASAADNVRLWNGLTGEHIFTYTGHAISVGLEVQAVAWSPNGRYIASGGMEGTVQVWNALNTQGKGHGTPPK